MNMYVHSRLNQKMVSKAEAQRRDTIKPYRGLSTMSLVEAMSNFQSVSTADWVVSWRQRSHMLSKWASKDRRNELEKENILVSFFPPQAEPQLF